MALREEDEHDEDDDDQPNCGSPILVNIVVLSRLDYSVRGRKLSR